MKVAINNCFGGFDISDKAFEKLINEKGWSLSSQHNDDAQILELKQPLFGKYSFNFEIDNDDLRSNKDLISVIEELGDEANSRFSEIKIVEVPDDVEWEIKEYDGNEWVAEKHRTWR